MLSQVLMSLQYSDSLSHATTGAVLFDLPERKVGVLHGHARHDIVCLSYILKALIAEALFTILYICLGNGLLTFLFPINLTIKTKQQQ